MAEGVEEALQSALSLRRPWKALQSSPSAAQLKSIVADRRSKPWRSVEDLRADLHQPVIDGLQRILDRLPQTESEIRMTALESLQAISALSGRLPQRMIIQSVESDRDSPSDGGGFGDVFFGRAGSKNVALKVLRIFRGGSNDEYERSLKVFRREALLWYQLRHPHILSLIGVNTTTFDPRPCLVSPFMKNGNVNQFLDNNPTHDRLQMMIDIMEGIHFLHTHDPPLVHADIRGANILVKDDLTCCLADFGLSMICDSLATSSRIRGGPTRWLAPEVLIFSVGDNAEFPASDLPSRDMYAFACTAIEICSRKYPFSDVPRDAAVYQEVVKRRRKPLPPPTTYLPQRVWDVVYRCLEYEAMSRPNAGLVLKTLKVVMAMPIKLDRRRLVVGVQVQDECDTNTLSTLSDTFMPLEWNGTRKSLSIATPSRIPSLLSWSDIDPSSFPREIRRKVEDIILQPCTKPWEDVHMIRPELYQIIMDSLQVALDHLPAMESGFARHAAIKCLQAISRISDVLPSDLALQDVQELRKMPIEGGGFANIYDGMYRSQRVCLKVLKVLTSGDPARVAKAFCRKALLWRQLHHPRILPLLCMTPYTRPRFCLVSPWMHNGNVNQFLRKHPTSDKLKMLTEIIEGIEYLHTHDPPIVHADIRGASILVKDDFTCCLAEFGLTTAMGIRTITNSWFGQGTSYWMSPEVWNENVDADVPARDIYSFGCTVIELYSGQHPFPGLTIPARIYHEVVVMKHKPPRPIEVYDPDLWAIVDRCLAFNPRERPTASDIIHMLDTYASCVIV